MRVDLGLGTLYERRAIYALLERWLPDGIETALEGPVDGMAGMPGLHLLPAARRGARVTVAVPDTEAAEAVRIVYARAGLSDRLETCVGEPPPDRRADLVLSFNALHEAIDWRGALARTLSATKKCAIVVVTNRHSYGVGLRRLMRLVEKRHAPEPWEHESTRASAIEPELRRFGRIADRAWLDCPWWPDLFVDSGETLVGATLRRIGMERAASSRFTFDAESFPFAEDSLSTELRTALARHPGFDGRGEWGSVFAHHRAYRVEV